MRQLQNPVGRSPRDRRRHIPRPQAVREADALAGARPTGSTSTSVVRLAVAPPVRYCSRDRAVLTLADIILVNSSDSSTSGSSRFASM